MQNSCLPHVDHTCSNSNMCRFFSPPISVIDKCCEKHSRKQIQLDKLKIVTFIQIFNGEMICKYYFDANVYCKLLLR